MLDRRAETIRNRSSKCELATRTTIRGYDGTVYMVDLKSTDYYVMWVRIPLALFVTVYLFFIFIHDFLLLLVLALWLKCHRANILIKFIFSCII